jgi:hypothetical protein
MIQGRTVNYPLFGGVIPEFWSVVPDESIQLSLEQGYYPVLTQPGIKEHSRLNGSLNQFVKAQLTVGFGGCGTLWPGWPGGRLLGQE